MLIDIIVHGAWVICMSTIDHIAFIIYVTWYRNEMAHCIVYAWGHRIELGVCAWLLSFIIHGEWVVSSIP